MTLRFHILLNECHNIFGQCIKLFILFSVETTSNAGGSSETMLGGRQPVVKLEPLKTDPLKPVAYHIGMTSKQIMDACK